MLADNLGVFRALTHEDWIDEGEVTEWAFLRSHRDKDGLSLLGQDRIEAFEVAHHLKTQGLKQPVLGTAESVVNRIRGCQSCITKEQLDVTRTPEESDNPLEPHCTLQGLSAIPDPRKGEPTDDHWEDALALKNVFQLV